MKRRGKVAVLHSVDKTITIVEEEVVKPTAGEILVRVSAAGICGSDIHRIRGDLPVSTSAASVCFGHEVVGVIEELGEDFTFDTMGNPLQVGDSLYWMPLSPCGICRECRNFESLRCKDLNWPPPAGSPNAAGFRQYATLTKQCTCIRVPPHLNPEHIIALGCALPTAIAGLKRLGPISPNANVVIQGSGPVGLACLILAKIAEPQSLIVIGDPMHRLDIAQGLGATATMSLADTTPEERREKIFAITSQRGANLVIEAAGVASAFPEGLELLAHHGIYLILGLYSGTERCEIDPVRINNFNLHIIGSLGIVQDSFQAAVDFASQHGERLRLADLITHRFPLEQLKEGIMLADRGIPVKAVIVP
ncbi:hypothetical protein CERZMDRAFT_113585 [Cercospora zeae-maydis SCOH1-5]|uniref:Enoyl reductase (ER) domain-containing protein n=1 Tax=Cercospora zeae-maydis SCOH1-5 TaxID=717836 RepID=A0A6A6F8V7_9PEZI|nr:hypothetical protein CERZMDRAFT_113585 [Cercospora zeae-maydis SCOH1-5]